MSIKLLKKIHCLVESITGETFYIAGGAVVDSLYGKEPKDYDLVLPLPSTVAYHEDCGNPDVVAHKMIEGFAHDFGRLGFSVKVYQSYGLNTGEEINDTSFQAMFYSCMKVQMGNCQLDILLSKADCIEEHVKRHDCNMNMVWFDGREVQWEHGGNEAKVPYLEFRDGVCADRIRRMKIKYHHLCSG